MTHIRRAIMGERWEVLEIHIRCADGKVRTVLWNSATIFDTDGTTIVAIIAQGQDITERKRAGEALQKSEKRFKDISFSMADWIWEVDEKGVYTYCSEKIREILGYSQNEVLGKTPFDFMPPEEAEKIASIFKGILDQKKPIKDLENWNIARDGRKICLLTNGIPLLDTDGNITGYRGVDKDITKRKLAEEALASEKERLAVTLASIGDGVIATDTNGKVLIFNKIAESLTGWTEEEAFGKPLSEVFHIKNEQTQKICENPVELVLRLGKVIGLANNTVLVSRDGTERIIADSGAPILDKKGNILGVVLVFHDVTETRRLQELATRAQRLETAGRIAGQVAHDFNNLLGPLVAFPELAREELAPNHQVIKYIDAMEKSAKKIADINQQLLTLGRRGHYGQVTLNLNEIITDIINQISHSGKIRIIRNLHQNLMNIKGGPAQIHRIIANLISNAIDAMQDRGELTVKTENYYVEDSMGKYGRIPKGEYAKITISDTGSGIPEKIMSKIFDPFFTTKKTDKQRGSGLGLSVVHAVVEDHGGFIDLESEVRKGASFYLYFPITREDIETVEENYVPGGRESILIIDDDPVQRDVSIKLLGKLGYEIRTVESGEKAAELVKEKVYDLLILDMIMPNGIDGAETYKRILESNPYQKAVIVSGFAQTDRVNMALDLGASEYILKPLTIKSIARAIRKALDEKKESPVK
jgi:PAS domain S-box-containing protein